MKWQLVFGLALSLICGSLASSAQEPEERAEAIESKPEKPASRAYGLIYIQPGTGRDNANTAPLYALLRSEDVQQAAIKAVAQAKLGSVPDDLKKVDFSLVGGTNTTHVLSYDERLPAGLLLKALQEQAAARLLGLDTPLELQQVRADAQRHLEQAEAKWKGQRQQLTELAKRHRLEVDADAERQRRLQLALETQRLEVELKGLSARKKILETQLAELTTQPNDESSKIILIELQRIVEARQEQLARLREAQARNDRPSAERALEQIAPTKAELAQAELELARFQREASRSNSQRAVELRRQLDDTFTQIAELKVKLDELSTLDRPPPQIDDLRMEVDLAEDEYRRARQERDEIEAELRRYTPPRVLLIRIK